MIKYIGKNKGFNVFEEGVDQDVMDMFHDFRDSLSDEELEIVELDEDIDELLESDLSDDYMKLLLVRLSSTDNIKAYRCLQQFSETAVDDLKKWSVVACQQSRALIEASLSDEERVFIVSGLGGLGDKLRYFAILNTHDNEVLSTWQTKVIRDELAFSADMNKADIEEVNVHETYVTILCLLPVDKSISAFFKTTVDSINELGNFLSEIVVVTNTKRFTEDEIQDYLLNGTDALFGEGVFPEDFDFE